MNRLLVAALFALLASTAANATDRWVSTSGNDANACTTGSRCLTIARGLAVAAAGDNVNVVGPGTYTVTPFASSKAGTLGNVITLRATDTAGTLMRAVVGGTNNTKLIPANANNGNILMELDGQYVTVDGFELDGRAPNGTDTIRVGMYASPTVSGGLPATGTGPIIFQYNWVHHVYNVTCGLGGISTGGAGITSDEFHAADAVTHFYNNYVNDVGLKSPPCTTAHGLYQGATGDLKNNIAVNNSGMGIEHWHDARSNNVVNNTTCFNGYAGIHVGQGEQYRAVTNWSGTVTNNIACNNNPISGTGGYGILVGGSGTVVASQSYANNLLTGNNTNNFLNNSGSAGVCTTCSTTPAPVFVNSATGDYHLQTGSPGIDQGISTNAPATDFAGTSRPQNSVYDIGAYEYLAGTPTGCYDVGPTWQNVSAANQTTNFTWTFDVTPGSGVDTTVGMSAVAAAAFTDLAVAVAFVPSGVIQALNGTTYTGTQAYTAGLVYNFRVVVDIPTHKYNVFVTPPSASEVQIASSYDFRIPEQSGVLSLANVGVNTDVGTTSRICNIGVQTTTSSTATITRGPSVVLPKTSSYGRTVPAEAFTATWPAGATDMTELFMKPAAPLTGGTIVFPSSPIANRRVCISTTQNISALSISPGSGETVAGWANGSPLNANTLGSKCWKFLKEDNTWYPEG